MRHTTQEYNLHRLD